MQTQRHNNIFFEPTYIPRALNTGTYTNCLWWTGWPFSFWGTTQEPVLAAANTRKTRERFGENTGEWTKKVDINKEEIPGSRWSMHDRLCTDFQALKGKP